MQRLYMILICALPYLFAGSAIAQDCDMLCDSEWWQNTPDALRDTVIANAKDMIDGRDAFGATPLMYAARLGNFENVRDLLMAGARLDAHEGHERSVLMYAAKYADVDVVNILISAGADVNETTRSDKFSVIMYAAENQTSEVTIALIEAGADVNYSSGKGFTALMAASLYQHPSETVEALLSAGAHVNAQDNYGITALHLAVKEGQSTTVGLLLAAGAEVDALTTHPRRQLDRRTPLMIAAERRGWSSDIIVALLDAGADPSLRNRNGRTAYELAVRFVFTDKDSDGFNRLRTASVQEQ